MTCFFCISYSFSAKTAIICSKSCFPLLYAASRKIREILNKKTKHIPWQQAGMNNTTITLFLTVFAIYVMVHTSIGPLICRFL